MSPSISPEATKKLKQYIHHATSPGASLALPHTYVHIVDASNNVLFSHGSGPLTPPTAASVSVIHSLSKLVGAIAYMQLVERGVASLDDPTLIPTFLPELARQKVLTGRADGEQAWQYEDQKGDITPRMLLNHTYGGGHTFFNTLLLEYVQHQGDWAATNELVNVWGTLLASPLLWQPGTKTNYAQGLDWIAVLIERITKRDLSAYLHDEVFAPLGLESMGYQAEYGGEATGRAEKEGQFWPRKVRAETGFVTIDAASPVRVQRDDAFPRGAYHSKPLGTGLVASAADYAHLLTILLPGNAGVDPVSGYRVLAPASVEEITSAQLPELLREDTRTIPTSGASPIVLPAVLSAPSKDPEGSFGLACGVQGADRVLSDGRKGRSTGSVYWYGAANTEFWVDKEKGVVVYVNGNYYPWNEEVWGQFVEGVEGLLYEGLEG